MTVTSQDVKAFSQKVAPYWASFMPYSHSKFAVKICYRAMELAEPTVCARFFPSEVQQDFYFEPYNFNLTPYTPGQRELYVLRYRNKTELEKIAVFIESSKTWLVPFEVFELVHTQSADDPAPGTNEPAMLEAMPLPEADDTSEAPLLGDMPDVHPNELSVRDQFALKHSVPVSNNAWINDMVNYGNALKKQQAVDIARAIQLDSLSN